MANRLNGSPCWSGRSNHDRLAVAGPGIESSPVIESDVTTIGSPSWILTVMYTSSGVRRTNVSIASVRIAAPAVQDDQPYHIAAELLLVEVSLGAEAQPAEEKARANQLEFVVAMAAASTSSGIALLPSKLSWRTTSCACWAAAGGTSARVARRQTNRTARLIGGRKGRPGTVLHGPKPAGGAAAVAWECHTPRQRFYARRRTDSRLTACPKPGSLTILRRSVNVRGAAGRRCGRGVHRPGRCPRRFFAAPGPPARGSD